MSTSTDPVVVACSVCRTVIEVCAFCDRPDCPELICYRCLRVDLGQSMDHPHEHGG